MLCRIPALSLLMLCSLGEISLRADPDRTCALVGSVSSAQKGTIPAEVTAYRLDVRKGVLLPHVECSTPVDAHGAFQCERLQAGAYVLVITLPQLPAHEEHPMPPSPSVAHNSAPPAAFSGSSANQSKPSIPMFMYYPNVSALQTTNLIHLAAGQTQTADIEVDSDTMSTLKAKPALGYATGQVQIFADGEDFSVPLNIQAGVDASDGSYVWRGVPPGTYKLVEDWNVGDDTREATRTVTVPTATTKEISLAGDQFYQVRGTATDQKGAIFPVSDLILSASTEDQTRRYSASAQKDGSFAFKDVVQGTYRISFAIGDHTSVSQFTVAGKSSADNVIVVGEGTSEQQLSLVEKPAAGILTGILKLDGSEQKPGVVIQSLDSHSVLAVPVQAGGSFTIMGLAPGEYRISGWADISAVPYESPAFLARYVDHSVTLHLDDGAGATGLEIECSKSDL